MWGRANVMVPRKVHPLRIAFMSMSLFSCEDWQRVTRWARAVPGQANDKLS